MTGRWTGVLTLVVPKNRCAHPECADGLVYSLWLCRRTDVLTPSVPMDWCAHERRKTGPWAALHKRVFRKCLLIIYLQKVSYLFLGRRYSISD